MKTKTISAPSALMAFLLIGSATQAQQLQGYYGNDIDGRRGVSRDNNVPVFTLPSGVTVRPDSEIEKTNSIPTSPANQTVIQFPTPLLFGVTFGGLAALICWRKWKNKKRKRSRGKSVSLEAGW